MSSISYFILIALAKFLVYNVRRGCEKFSAIAFKLHINVIFVIIGQPSPQNRVSNIYFEVNLIFFHKCFGHIVVLTNSKAMCKFCHKNKKIDKNSTSHNFKASVQKVRYKHFAWAQFLSFFKTLQTSSYFAT